LATVSKVEQNNAFHAARRDMESYEAMEIRAAEETSLKAAAHNGGRVGSRIKEALKTALSIDDISFHSFNATVPQMITMLHHKTVLRENIESTPVCLEPTAHWRGE
jgi:hypothetical protein